MLKQYYLEVNVKIIKKINNSAAIGLDSSGNELVVIGRGIGYPQVPYELNDLSSIEKTFYGVEPKFYSSIENIPTDIVMAAAEIAEIAEDELGKELNPNLPITLADHLDFAIERIRKGIDISIAISDDVKHFYPKEYSVGEKALRLLQKRDIYFPASEAVSIALHLLNSEFGTSDMPQAIKNTKIVVEVCNIIENNLQIKINTESYDYSRFNMHMRYLINKLEKGEKADSQDEEMLNILAKQYPEIHQCAMKLSNYFLKTWKWECSGDDILYLMLHINRLKNKSER